MQGSGVSVIGYLYLFHKSGFPGKMQIFPSTSRNEAPQTWLKLRENSETVQK